MRVLVFIGSHLALPGFKAPPVNAFPPIVLIIMSQSFGFSVHSNMASLRFPRRGESELQELLQGPSEASEPSEAVSAPRAGGEEGDEEDEVWG